MAAPVEYEEESEILELNPAAALQTVMDHFEKMPANGRRDACSQFRRVLR